MCVKVARDLCILLSMLASPCIHALDSHESAGTLADAQYKALFGGTSEWTRVTSAEGQQLLSPKGDSAFLQEVEVALGGPLSENSKEKVADIQMALRPIFASLDKNEYGRVGHTAVRYALYRLFVARHGWVLKGLDPLGKHFNSSSPVLTLQNKTSLDAQGLFETRLGGRGFGIEELAVFASVLETLVWIEAIERVQHLFKILDVPTDRFLTRAGANKILELYMTTYIMDGTALNLTTKESILSAWQQMPEMYSFWPQTKQFLQSICFEVLGTKEMVSFSDVRRILLMVGERFGKFQDKDCQLMKKRLITLEADEQGCVPLTSFYKGAHVSGGEDWQFAEDIHFLRSHGVLDESDSGSMKVMIANYVNSRANCIASSQYYSVCCIDECMSLLGQIERHVQAPTADPHELARFLETLPSSTVAAHQGLPRNQIRRLHKIAEKHHKRVPLHGRLFMQWMHMAYPRECAYPHISGTTKPFYSNGIDDVVTEEAMMQVFRRDAVNSSVKGDGQCGIWEDAEELILGPTGLPKGQLRNLHDLEHDWYTWMAALSVSLLCVISIILLAIVRVFKVFKLASSVHSAHGGLKGPIMLV